MPDAPSPPPGEPDVKGAERLRDTAKWLLATQGAIGAVLVAGLSLSSLGEIGGERLVWALVGFATAIVGVLVAAIACGTVLARPGVSLGELADEKKVVARIERDQALLAALPSGGVTGLSLRQARAVVDQQNAYRRYLQDPADPHRNAEFDRRDAEVVRLNGLVQLVTARGTFLVTLAAFRRASVIMVSVGLVAAAGVGLFAWAANPPDDQPQHLPVVLRTPTAVVVTLSAGGRARHGTALGGACVSGAVPATALEALPDGAFRVGVATSSTCRTALLTITPADGTVALPPS